MQLLNHFTLETLISVAIIVYFTRVFVKMADGFLSQSIWFIFSLVGVYRVLVDNTITLLSGYSIVMITIFLSVLFPISKHLINLFRKSKKVIFRCKPSDLPKYDQKFGLPPEQLQIMKEKHSVEQKQKSIQTQYMNKLLTKLDKI